MGYIALARKYRPQIFDEIVGEEHVVTTLKNAIAMDMVSHAYLFAGPRGVGKTSTARILAKGLNCEKGPTKEPCGECVSCIEISEGRGMDVIEIDGASNRGIDEIRNLKENIKFASLHGKFRIYIIDEVHMLTQEAFNALLKTLEEPPAHVKFIFATTRPHKVLPTILSRCQRFDFRKISTGDIAGKLKEIREKEALALSDEAILLIARSSDGSLRDAEVILDQLLSFTEGKIESGDVVKVLGFLEDDLLFNIAGSILNNEKEKLLGLVNDLVNGGKDPTFITSSIIGHFRNLLVVKITKEKSISDMAIPEEKYYKFEEQSRHLSLDEILYVIYTLSATMDLIKKTNLGRIPLEISLIKLTERKNLRSIKELLDRVTLLEKKLEQSSIPSAGLGMEGESETPPTKPLVIPEIPQSEIMQERDILLLQKIKSSWPKILNLLRMKKMSIATFLSEGELIKVQNSILTIGFNKDNLLHKETLEENTNKKFVEEAIKNVLGEDVFLQTKILEYQSEALPPEMPAEIEETGGNIEKGLRSVDPIVESALDMFNGRVVNIRQARREEKG